MLQNFAIERKHALGLPVSLLARISDSLREFSSVAHPPHPGPILDQIIIFTSHIKLSRPIQLMIFKETWRTPNRIQNFCPFYRTFLRKCGGVYDLPFVMLGSAATACFYLYIILILGRPL
jgi:hypothetical protein